MGKAQQKSNATGGGSNSRRTFLKGFAALGASALVPRSQLSAQAPTGKARAIDCHHHFGSPGYAKLLNARGAAAGAGGFRRPGYAPASGSSGTRWETYSWVKHADTLEQQGVATAVLSVTWPGIWFGDPEETRAMARDMNDFGARLMSDYKTRFGLFALLPFPVMDASLREIEYAFDTLHADGVCVFTSYEERYWLGDPIFRPALDELNRRKAVVFVHPAAAFWDREHSSTTPFLTDTMRTIHSLLQSGPGPGNSGAAVPGTAPVDRYPDIRFIFSHAGGTFPSLIERFGVCDPGMLDEVVARPAAPNTNLARLRRFYYDTGNSCNSVQLQGLKTIVGASQIVFGSDYPIIESPGRQLQGLAKSGFNAKELTGIHRGNVERLFPRLNGTA